METSRNFSVFIENLGALNAGYMVGDWVTFPCERSTWLRFIDRIGNPEEIIITDVDNCTGIEFTISEYSTYKRLQTIAEYIADIQQDPYKEKLFIAICEGITSDFNEIKEAIETEQYTLVEGYTLAEYMEYLYTECGENTIPEELKYYIDWKRYAHEQASDYYTETSTGVLIVTC